MEKDDSEKNLLNATVTKIQIIKQENIQPVLSFVDIFLSIFVVTPLVVFSWRGAWGLIDVYKEYFPPFPTFLVGIMVHIILAVLQDSLHTAIIESEKHWTLKIVSHFLRRFYTYLFLIQTILHWRGAWLILDYYTNVQSFPDGRAKKEGCLYVILVSGACFITLICMKGLRNATAPPFSICLDKGSYVFRFPTMFKSKVEGKPSLYILDCIFSVAVVGNLVIFFWRGFWVLVDVLLIPNDYTWSSWTSLILGYILVGLVYRLQSCMKTICSKLKGFSKLVAADFYIILSIVSTVMYWRGVWNLLYIYLLPNDVQLSCILSHIIGVMVLVVLGCSNSMLVRGVYKDAKEPNGECVVFPCQFLQLILEQENIVSYSSNSSSNDEDTDLKEQNILNYLN